MQATLVAQPEPASCFPTRTLLRLDMTGSTNRHAVGWFLIFVGLLCSGLAVHEITGTRQLSDWLFWLEAIAGTTSLARGALLLA